MPGFQEKVTQPFVFASILLRELETSINAISSGGPKHFERALHATGVVASSGICENCCIIDGFELPEIPSENQIDATPTPARVINIIPAVSGSPRVSRANVVTHVGLACSHQFAAKSAALIDEDPTEILRFQEEATDIFGMVPFAVGHVATGCLPTHGAEGMERVAIDDRSHAML